MLNAFKVLGKSDVEIKELHKVVCQVDKPIEYVTCWLRVKKLVARGFLERLPPSTSGIKTIEKSLKEIRGFILQQWVVGTPGSSSTLI